MTNTDTESPIFVSETRKYVAIEGNSHGVKTYRTTDKPDDKTKFLDRLGDSSYLEVRSGSPRISADLLFFDPKTSRVLVATRQQEPQHGDWVVGGRVPAGKSPAEAAILKARDELKLRIDPERLVASGVYNLIWDTRQEPVLDVGGNKYGGSHDESHLFLYLVTGQEIEAMDFDKEYRGLRWVDPFEIVDAPVGQYHPAFVDMVSTAIDKLTQPDLTKMTEDDQILHHMGAIATIKSTSKRGVQK